MAKTKIISDFVAGAVKLAISFIETAFIKRIQDETVRTGLLTLLQPIKDTLTVASDDNPANEQQIAEVWKKFTNQKVTVFADQELAKALAKIADENIRKVLTLISVPSVNMIRIHTDDNPDNGAQVKALWDSFRKSPDTIEVVLDHLLEPILDDVIKDEATLSFILGLIGEAIRRANSGALSAEAAARISAKYQLTANTLSLRAQAA